MPRPQNHAMADRHVTEAQKVAFIDAAELKLIERGNVENAREVASMLCGACLAQTRKPLTYRAHIVKNIRRWLARFPDVCPPDLRHLNIDHVEDQTIIDVYEIVAR